MLTAPYITGHSLIVDGGASLGMLHWWDTVNGMMTGKIKPDDLQRDLVEFIGIQQDLAKFSGITDCLIVKLLIVKLLTF